MQPTATARLIPLCLTLVFSLLAGHSAMAQETARLGAEPCSASTSYTVQGRRGNFEVEVCTLKDGVVRYSRIRNSKQVSPQPQNRVSAFWQTVAEMFNREVPTAEAKLPFGRSVALLAGVKNYKNRTLKTLDFVPNDLESMRQFLMDRGGFDLVYVAFDDKADKDKVDYYMTTKFGTGLNREDRLLFYFSGHGKDLGDKLGYMLFGGWEGDATYHALPLERAYAWSRLIPAKHLLLIYDACASGIGVSKGASDSDTSIIDALSGERSRLLLTAGTGGEEVWGVAGMSVFTRALLQAADNLTDKPGFTSLNRIWADLYDEVAREVKHYGKPMTPHRWEIGPTKGDFVFLNSKVREPEVPRSWWDSIAAILTHKGAASRVTIGRGDSYDLDGRQKFKGQNAAGTDLSLVEAPRDFLIPGQGALFTKLNASPEEFPSLTADDVKVATAAFTWFCFSTPDNQSCTPLRRDTVFGVKTTQGLYKVLVEGWNEDAHVIDLVIDRLDKTESVSAEISRD